MTIDSQSDPFDVAVGELIDVDVVLRDRIPASDFDVYVGCGTCTGPVSASNLAALHVESPYEVEPFTQTRYHSVLVNRTFDAALLVNCSSFTIRLVQRGNQTIVWSAVIGMKESFTNVELLSFPVYILKNHGSAWNDMAWTIWIALLAAPVLLNVTRLALSCFGVKVFYPYTRSARARELLYEIALLAFLTATVEIVIHLMVVQVGVEIAWGFYVGLFVVGGVNLVGVLFIAAVWKALRHSTWCSASPAWAPLEIATGFGFLYLFGAGFFVAPAAIMIAGILRLGECRRRPRPQHVVQPPPPVAPVIVELQKPPRIHTQGRSNGLGFL